MKSAFVVATPPLHAAALLPLLLATASLVGCSSLDGALSSDKLDYRSQATKIEALDVPPDLTQLARDGRYQPQSGVISASNLRPSAGSATAALAATAATASAVAASSQADMRIERDFNSRWLVTKLPPETLFPLVRTFWAERGFTLNEDSAEAGIMETNWAENRAKLPSDFMRNALGKMFENLFGTGERDRFRTRIERTATGSEVYISHRGIAEVYINGQRDETRWQTRANDPGLEAEMLARLMVKLGAKDDAARVAVAQAAVPALVKAQPISAADAAAGKTTPAAAKGASAMTLAEPFDRAWRRVGLALDRSGFTVEDRDRSAGLYFVRYIDPKLAGKEEPNFFSKLFSGDKDSRPQRYRVLVKASGAASQVTVQNNLGVTDDSDIARQIIARLVEELR